MNVKRCLRCGSLYINGQDLSGDELKALEVLIAYETLRKYFKTEVIREVCPKCVKIIGAVEAFKLIKEKGET